jgi:mannitol/fructose-specific phosphotransferase system IIA component
MQSSIMRLGIICALFMGAAIAIPHGGAQEVRLICPNYLRLTY